MHRKSAQARIRRWQAPRKFPAGKLLALLVSFAFIASFAFFFPAAAHAARAGTKGDMAEPAVGIEGLKQAIADYAGASDEGLSAPDVASFINDYGMDVGIAATPSFGSEYPFNPADTPGISATALTDSKFAVAYSNGGHLDYGEAIIGDITGNVITFGPPALFNSATSSISATALTDSKFAVAYYDGDSTDGRAIIGDITGNVITFGPPALFNSATTNYISATALTETRFAVAYCDAGNSNYGTAVIGDVTGNAIAFGSEYVFNSATTYDVSATALTETRFAVAYRDGGNSGRGTATIGGIDVPALLVITNHANRL